MNLELIKAFAVLGELCHYGEAARRLNISQPSLTKQIRRLEDLLGAPLFIRGRQGTELTALGRAFLKDVQPVLLHADHVWENGVRAARGERGRLSIGFTFSAVEVMSRALFRFRTLYPAIDVGFEDISSRHQVRRVKEGSLDAGFVRLPAGEGLSCHPVAKDRLVLVVPARLAAEVASFDDAVVRDQAFLALQPTFAPGLEDYVQAVFKSRGFQPREMHRVNESLTMLTLVAAGFGVALMHESALRRFASHAEGIAVRPVPGSSAEWDVGLVWNGKDPNPVVRRFVDTAVAALAVSP